MLVNSVVAMSEMERRYEYVSAGAENARWLRRLAKEGLRIGGDRLAQAAGKALVAVGTWLQQERHLSSAHS